MQWKNRAWKLATGMVVLLFILNPETIELALFINVIGLEVFLLLLEAQLIALFGVMLGNPVIRRLVLKKSRIIFCGVLQNSRAMFENPGRLVLVVPGGAALMHAIVFSAMASELIYGI